MNDEYQATKKMDNPNAQGWADSEQGPEWAANEYRPTVQMNAGSGGGGGYGYGGDTPAANKTLRLKREPPSFAWLVIVEGIHAGHIFKLHVDATIIGRDPSSCEIVIDDPSISRQHAKVRVMEDDDKKKVFMLYDLATENGTLLNGKEVVREALHDGDQVLIGQTRLVFKQVQI